MIRGWFVADCTPVPVQTRDGEIAINRCAAGDHKAPHWDRVATGVTATVTRCVRMMDGEFGAGESVVLAQGEAARFEALTDAATVVAKPSSIAGHQDPAT